MRHLGALLGLVLLGCPSPDSPDAGTPPEVDAGRDSGSDAGSDAGPLPSCGTGSPLELAVCVEDARWAADLATIAMPREPSSAHWMATQDLCATRLADLGFTVERHAYATGVNVIGTLAGTSTPEREVVLGAHYDHIPGCDGADDNASGVAGMLEAVRVLSMADHPSTLVAVCWDEEERGLIGSQAHADRAAAAGEDIVAVFDFEMIGYTDGTPGTQTVPTGFDVLFRDAYREVERNEFRADFIAVVGDPASDAPMTALEHYADRVGLPFVSLPVPASLLTSPLLADLRRSDHASFWDRGVAAMMITDTSNFRYASYHCFGGDDVTANLDVAFASQVVRATVGAVAETLGMPR